MSDEPASTVLPDHTIATVEPFLPPSAEFSCADIGPGWKAAAVPTEYRLDDIGFDLWYSIDGSETRIYWGKFKSGISAPTHLGRNRSSNDAPSQGRPELESSASTGGRHQLYPPAAMC